MRLLRRPKLVPVLDDVPPGLGGVGPWFNVPEGRVVELDGLMGRVVLLEFWTFVCGNCTRTVPLLNRLADAHGPEDLQIVGVHTPELGYDRDPALVQEALSELGIRYPVGLDNDFAAWNRWGVQAWPTMFLIDRHGHLRARHVGEGGQNELRRTVEGLIAEDSSTRSSGLGDISRPRGAS